MAQIKNVFLIDDGKSFNFVHEKLMQKAHFGQHIQSFNSAASALAVLRQLSLSHPEQFPDIIFLDINMPGMNGWEFLDSVKDLSESVLRNCKIFMLTSSIDQADIDHSRMYEMVNDFASKPLTEARLQDIAVEPGSTNKKN